MVEFRIALFIFIILVAIFFNIYLATRTKKKEDA